MVAGGRPAQHSFMNPRTRYWIVHWLDALTWPASLVLKGVRKTTQTVGRAAQFMRHDIEWSRGAYMIIDRRTANPIARLRPIPETDRFELFYWSNVKGRWTTFGNLGRMKLMLESAHEIVENDPMFRVPRSR